MKQLLIQTLLLSLVSLVFTSPRLIKEGTNIVTNTYALASERFWRGESPYQPPMGVADTFKYSPFFAMAYAPIGMLSSLYESLLWACLNIFVFWLGVSGWFRLEKKSPLGLWIAFIACSMELDGSTRYQQTNSLLIGLTLIALLKYKQEKYFLSGFLLAIATNLKLLPGLFLFPLLLDFKKQYWRGCAIGLGFALLTPIVGVGVASTWELHWKWSQLIAANAQAPGILDVATILSRYGWEEAGQWSRNLILLTSVVILVAPVIKKHIPWHIWISVGITCLLLTSPRTESPTFVLVGPCYLFLTAEILKRGPGERWRWLLLYIAVFLISFSYNDLWPKRLWNPGEYKYATKVLGVLVLWAMGHLLLSVKYIFNFRGNDYPRLKWEP